MTVIIIDTETTGIDAPEAVEVAWVGFTSDPTSLSGNGYPFCQRYQPSKPISLGAMATHHIMDEDLVDCPPPSDFTLPPDVDYLVGHNIDFDWRVIGEPSVKRICTLALCREIYPEIDSHSLSAMFYHLYRDKARERLEHAHSALADTFLCRDILVKIVDHLGVTTWDALYQASESARIPKVMPFGKHKGVAIADVPRDYKAWLLRQPDVDAYLIEAFKA